MIAVNPNSRYRRSQELLERARRVIPLGTQTFSKSYQQYPQGESPLFLTHGRGGRVWDVDGNEYVDLVSGLLPVVLGYCDPDVDTAVTTQMASGMSFSLATELEIEVAEALVEIIPCAEMVRFGKNGTDATSAAVRLARAFTGRERIVAIGYHGWQDWYVGATTRSRGVPKSVGELTHKAAYNNLQAVAELFGAHRGEVAAVIIEPTADRAPDPGYLEALRDLVHENGALLIFDEVITGFRFALGGAQELFSVTPDLAAFGKAMGNGLPISAVVGRADIMQELDEVFISATFGGETLSLAAAKAVITKMRSQPVIDHLWSAGQRLAEATMALVAQHELGSVFELRGAAPWKVIAFNDHATASKEAIKTLFMVEMLRHGVLVAASHNITYAHDEADRNQVLSAYDAAFSVIAKALAAGNLETKLTCPPILPVFQVRG
jgi:glutamate-1-semialdehyde 2,1-aminomutase